MSADDDLGANGDWAPPPFNADNALVQIKRGLRDLKLSERGNAYELRGKRVAELGAADGAVQVRLARKLALTPEWDRITVKTHTEQRKLLADVKQRLARWEREE